MSTRLTEEYPGPAHAHLGILDSLQILGDLGVILSRLKDLKESLDVLLLGILFRLALQAVPSVPLSAASKVEHTRALRVAVAIISLLEQTVELKLLGLRH